MSLIHISCLSKCAPQEAVSFANANPAASFPSILSTPSTSIDTTLPASSAEAAAQTEALVQELTKVSYCFKAIFCPYTLVPCYLWHHIGVSRTRDRLCLVLCNKIMHFTSWHPCLAKFSSSNGLHFLACAGSSFGVTTRASTAPRARAIPQAGQICRDACMDDLPGTYHQVWLLCIQLITYALVVSALTPARGVDLAATILLLDACKASWRRVSMTICCLPFADLPLLCRAWLL